MSLTGASGSVTISAASGSGTATITDNDSAELSINSVTVSEGVAGGVAEFAVTSSAAIEDSAALSFSLGYGSGTDTALGGGKDYDVGPGTGTISGGKTSVIISVPIKNDDTVKLSSPSTASS